MMTSPRRAAALILLIAIALLMAACGTTEDGELDGATPTTSSSIADGADGADGVDGADEGATEQSPAPATPIAATDEQLLLSETTPEFCEAGRVAFESFIVLDLIPQDATRPVVEGTMAQLLFDIKFALDVAPNEQLAEGPQVAFLAMNTIRNAAREFDFDGVAMQEAASNELRSEYDAFVAIMDALAQYLEGPCGLDLGPTYANAEVRYQTLRADEANRQDREPAVETPAVAEVRNVEGEWGGIVVSVPVGWTAEESWSDERSRGLAVAPDLSAFDSSWDADGLAITAINIDQSAPLDFDLVITNSAAAQECTPAGNGSYDDGLYKGEIHRFVNCGGGTTGAAVIAGVTSDRSLLVLVEVQMIDFDEDVLETIADSFNAS